MRGRRRVRSPGSRRPRGMRCGWGAAAGAPRLLYVASRPGPAAIRGPITRLAPGDGRSDLEAAVRVAAAQRLRGRPARVEGYTDAPGARLSRVGYRTFGHASENLTLTRAAASTSGSGRTLLLTEVRNFGGTARGEGAAQVSIEGNDVLSADDRAVALFGRAARPRVLLVSPGNPYLEAALSVLPVRRVDRTGEVDPASWGGYDLVVLDRVPATTLPPGRYLIVGTVPGTLPLDVGAPPRAGA